MQVEQQWLPVGIGEAKVFHGLPFPSGEECVFSDCIGIFLPVSDVLAFIPVSSSAGIYRFLANHRQLVTLA